MAKTILIVDDSKSVRAVIGTTLKMGGYTTMTAEDGKQALDMLAQQDKVMVDLIITDVNMPNMDGVTFIKELKKLGQYAGIPICVLTTETEQGKLEAEMHSLKDAWITKPVQPAHVLNIVGELLAD
jgi:two-component system chemotaxis response regulator CheY